MRDGNHSATMPIEEDEASKKKTLVFWRVEY